MYGPGRRRLITIPITVHHSLITITSLAHLTLRTYIYRK